MVSKRPIQPLPNQIDIEGEVFTPNPNATLGRERNALARTLTPDYLHLKETDFMWVQPEMLEAVEPRNMRSSLIDVPYKGKIGEFVLSYDDTRYNRQRYIAVTSAEAKTIPRHVPGFIRNAGISSQGKAPGPIVKDSETDRAFRAKIHAQESKSAALRDYYAGLQNQSELISKFYQASIPRNVGLSMFGPEITMRKQFSYLQTNIIGDMVRAYGENKGLNEAQMTMVNDTITYAMVFPARRLGYFHSLMGLASEYNRHKQEIAGQRLENMERNIERALGKLSNQ